MQTTIVEGLLLAFTYVATGGAVFTDWGKQHRMLAIFAGLVAIVTTVYFARDRYLEWSEPQQVLQNGNTITADQIFWLTIKDSMAPGLFEEFIKDFPASPHVTEARVRLEKIRNSQQTTPNQASDVSSPSLPKIRCVTFNGRQVCG